MTIHCQMCPRVVDVNHEDVKLNVFHGTTLKCGHTICDVCEEAWTALNFAKNLSADCPTCNNTYAVNKEPKKLVKFEDILPLFDKMTKVFEANS